MVSEKNNDKNIIALVADDSPTARMMTAQVLNEAGFSVIQACDGEEAIEIALREQPSIVVADLKMPKKDGFQVCQAIKTLSKTFIPVLLLTAKEDTSSLVQGLEAGADDYVIKPFNAHELIARIRVLLRLKKSNDDLVLLNQKLEFLSNHDELTGVYNHRYLINMLTEYFNNPDQSPACLALFDIDNFKGINDTYGHLEGDNAIRFVIGNLKKSFETDAILARYGGEEFIAFFPSLSFEAAQRACQKAIHTCSLQALLFDDSEYYLTISGGLTSTEHIKEKNPQALIYAADKLLYHSKKTGKNRLTSSGTY